MAQPGKAREKRYFLIQPRIPEDTYQGLKEAAAAQGLATAAFVRLLCFQAVKAHRKEQKQASHV
jgi:hypothetical protein